MSQERFVLQVCMAAHLVVNGLDLAIRADLAQESAMYSQLLRRVSFVWVSRLLSCHRWPERSPSVESSRRGVTYGTGHVPGIDCLLSRGWLSSNSLGRDLRRGSFGCGGHCFVRSSTRCDSFGSRYGAIERVVGMVELLKRQARSKEKRAGDAGFPMRPMCSARRDLEI